MLRGDVYIRNRQRAAPNVHTTLTQLIGCSSNFSGKVVGATSSKDFEVFLNISQNEPIVIMFGMRNPEEI